MMVLREVTERRPVNDFRDIGYRVDVPTAINLTWKLLAIVEMWRCCIWSHALITPLQQKRKSITEYVDAMPFPERQFSPSARISHRRRPHEQLGVDARSNDTG